MSETSTSKRLAKNTIFMYLRMGFLMLISLYTSRVILRQLGVEDYGVYNLVGSIVVMFVSLKAIFASSTQRFLSYEMGKGNHDKLQLIYTMSTVINVLIAIVFVILVEIVGLWFLTYKINVDPSRLVAAHWVFQFSVLSTVISIISTPLDACVIAHERMDFYAYLSIFEGLAKLGICFLLSLTHYDKLIVYGFLTLMIAILIRIINQVFCMRHFSECHLRKCWDKQYFIKMTSFAGWAFLGNTASALSQSGLNMVLNVFGGPIVNAARGLSYQVNSALNQFVGNITVVVKPYAIKTYASGSIDKAVEFTQLSSKIFFTVQLLLVISVTFLSERLLQLWLGQVPDYTVIFLNIIMIQSLIGSLHMPIDFLFCGEGNIKYYQIIEGVILALPVPLSYFLLKLGLPYYTALLSLVFCEILHIMAITLLATKICHLRLGDYCKSVVLPCIICSAEYGVAFYINSLIEANLLLVLANIIATVLVTVLTMYYIGLTSIEKQVLVGIVKKNENAKTQLNSAS